MFKLPGSRQQMERLPLLIASAFFLQLLSGSVLNTAIPSIAASMGEDPLRMHNVVIAYMLTLCALTPASGWLSDRFGSKKVYVFSIATFMLGSLLCALSPSVDAMVASRVVQGIGGAFLMPVGRLVILRAYPRRMFVKTLNFVTIPGLIGPLMGPILGGFLSQYASWHWIFLINIPIGALGLWATFQFMPDLRSDKKLRFDWLGFLLFSSSAILFSVSLESEGGTVEPSRLFSLCALGAAFQIAYWFLAFRNPQPLFGPGIFKIRHFSIGLAGNMLSRIGGSCIPYLLPLFFQVGLGFSASRSGLALLPMAIFHLLAKTVAVPLIQRLGYRAITMANTFFIGASLLCFCGIAPGVSDLLLAVLLSALGFFNSIQFTCMNTLTLVDLTDEHAASGNSLLAMIMQLCFSISVAAATFLLDAFGSSGNTPHSGLAGSPEVLDAFHMTFLTIGIASVASTFVFSFVDPQKGISRVR